MNTSLPSLYDPITTEINCFHRSANDSWFNESQPFRWHDAYEIYLFIQGDIKIFIEYTCYRLKFGDLIIINPNELHRGVGTDLHTYERVCINIKQPTLKRLSSEKTNFTDFFLNNPSGEKEIFHLNACQVNKFTLLANEISKALTSDEYGSDVLIDSYLIQLLLIIINQKNKSPYISTNLMPELIRDTMLYIKEHLTETIYLNHLSQKFYLNATHISREFKRYTGLTLRSYILNERISHAIILLNKGYNVTDACYMSGFNDYSNFIRSFTKAIGKPPGAYKKSLDV